MPQLLQTPFISPQNPIFRLPFALSPFKGAAFAPLALSKRAETGARGIGRQFLQQRRGKSTPRDEKRIEKGGEMGEKEEGYGFNKRRAEGRERSGKSKTLQLKSRKLNPVSTICYAQILGTGMDTQDTSPSVLLFFDKQRFIFNAGEGLQRFCTEHKIKLSKIDHIFFTRVCSETAGGLPGLLLTLAGLGDEGMSVNIWGSSDLNYLVAAMRNFIPNAAMVHVHSFGVPQDADEPMVSASELKKFSDPITLIDDEVVRISAIPLEPSCSYGSKLRPGEIAVVYACELPEIKGKFDPAKAAFLGLKPGPKYRELQLGNPVMSDSHYIMVHPNDVLGPSIPGPIVLLVDCPTPPHMTELLSAESLTCYYTDSTGKQKENYKHVDCIIHLGPASVTKSIDYQKWMKRFGDAQHIMAGHEMKNMAIPILKASARISSRLNYLCPQLFPAPGCWFPEHINSMSLERSKTSEDPSTHCEVIPAENLLKFHLRPYSILGLDKTAIPPTLDHGKVVEELISEIPEISDALKHIKQCISLEDNSATHKKNLMVEEPWIGPVFLQGNANLDCQEGKVKHDPYVPPCLHNITREDMEFVLLGTGSSQPSKYRNVSSVFVNLFSRGSILLDCGEGTLGQIRRRFGVKGADDAVKRLKCIWISHIHADHHTGLARILALRSQLLRDVPHEPVHVIGPRPLKRFLDAYSRLEDLDMQFLDCRHTLEASTNSSSENLDTRGIRDSGIKANASLALESTLFSQSSRMQSYWRRPGSPTDNDTVLPILSRLNEVLSEAGLETLYSVPVVHCPQAFGVVLKSKDRLTDAGKAISGWKLVYSGDSRPCQALIDASLDATVLIHEATFEETLADEAVARNHSTTKEAIAVGTAAGAYRIVLTHFSQRYPKIPVFDDADMQKTCIAFDLMSVNLADLPVLPKFLPYLKLLFRNDMITDESEDIQESAL